MTDWRFDVLTDHAGRPIIIDVHDGDTFRAVLDVGFEGGMFPWLRVAGIDAPELRERGGPEARAFLLATLTQARSIVVQTRKSQPRSFARYVARATLDVGVAVDGRDLAGLLVRAGHAVAVRR